MPDMIDEDDPALVEQLCRQVLPRRAVWATPAEVMITLGAKADNGGAVCDGRRGPRCRNHAGARPASASGRSNLAVSHSSLW